MTEAQANEALTAAFATGWPALAPNVPFAVENEISALPEIPPGVAESFAYIHVVHTTSDQLTSGETGVRLVGRNGWVQVKLWTPAGDRTEDARALVEHVRTVYEMRNIPGPIPGDETIDTMATSIQSIGNDGRWYMCLVRTPFTFYQTK